MTSIYLDNNSTSMIDPAVVEQFRADLANHYANPASQHALGRTARKILEATRQDLLRRLGASSRDRLIFTSGGSESNHMAVFGLTGPAGSDVVVSSIEHPSVIEPAKCLRQQGVDVRILPADRTGVWRIDRLADVVDSRTSLVSLMLANNETGVVQPIHRAVEICRAAGVPLHTDAVQAVGKIPVSFSELGVDALSFTAHKFHGPRGIGGLLLRQHLTFQSVWGGGTQQFGFRPGTEDVALGVQWIWR